MDTPLRPSRRVLLALAAVAALVTGTALVAAGVLGGFPRSLGRWAWGESAPDPTPVTSFVGPPTRFTIRPDDYHVPYAGTAEDGRKFFLSEELFAEKGYVGLFLWKADGTFDEMQVSVVGRSSELPPGQAGPAGNADALQQKLAVLGRYTLEPITVEPFTRTFDGTTFGWRVDQYDDGDYVISVHPGDFIAYSPPFDGRWYDT
ncbi:MAG: hypothetical protein IPL94_11595 [Tetrasphaera sp.]|nr:hypothetical protein [Tetrasphaera sp.]